MKIIFGAACAVLMWTAAAAVSAQNFTMPERIEKLAQKATDSQNISLDGPLLKLASMFLNSNDKDQATAKKIVSKLKAIHVRNFEFDKEGMYSEADLDALRSLLKSPPWSRVVDSKEKHEHTQIFLRQDKGEIGGVVIISAEAKELSIVSIDGAIDLAQLSRLGGSFGIPNDLPKAGGATKDSAE
jgi:hypothetical protein